MPLISLHRCIFFPCRAQNPRILMDSDANTHFDMFAINPAFCRRSNTSLKWVKCFSHVVLYTIKSSMRPEQCLWDPRITLSINFCATLGLRNTLIRIVLSIVSYHLIIIQQLCMHRRYAFRPAFFAAARRPMAIFPCRLLRPEPPLD